MRTRTRLAVVVAAGGLMLVAAVPALAANDTVPGLPVAVGIGDSWTFGQGAADPATGGYFARTSAMLETDLDCLPAAGDAAAGGCKHLQSYNIARPAQPGLPGVTTDAVIDEQLPVVVPLIEARNGDANPRNDVEVIYLSAGGNDVSGAVIQACIVEPSEQCQAVVQERLTHVGANMDIILGALRSAAGPETPIVLVTYDNPIPYCDLGGFPGAGELGGLLLAQLDAVYRGVAQDYDVDVATTLGALGEGDWVGGADCLHPTDSGHAKVAAIAAAAATD